MAAALFRDYQRGQAGRRIPPSVFEFRARGMTDVSVGPSGARQPDESFVAINSVLRRPAFVVEICNAQTLAQGDARAQAWLSCVHLAFEVKVVRVIKYLPRHANQTFAAVAALYQQGGGPGTIARTVNLVQLEPPVATHHVLVPGAHADDAVADVTVAPVAPCRVVNFGTSVPFAGAAMAWSRHFARGRRLPCRTRSPCRWRCMQRPRYLRLHPARPGPRRFEPLLWHACQCRRSRRPACRLPAYPSARQ
jgi:hypothetical protein